MTTNTKNCLRLIQEYYSIVTEIVDKHQPDGYFLSDDQENRANDCLQQTRKLESWIVSTDDKTALLADSIVRLRTKLKKKRKKNKKLKKQCEEYRQKAESLQEYISKMSQKAESLQEHISKMSQRVNSMLDPVKREEIVYGEPYLFIDDSNNKTIPNVVYVTYHLFHTAIYKVYFFKSVVSGQFITSTTSPKVFRIPGYTYPNVLSDAINPACH